MIILIFAEDYKLGHESTTVVSDRMLELLIGPELLELQHMMYTRLLIGFVVLLKLKSQGFSGRVFDLISSCLSNRQLGIYLDGKTLQEYPGNTGVF